MQCTHSLIYLCRDSEICLGYKKRGFGAGYWNGFGGKIEAGETERTSAVRELLEETSVAVRAEDCVPVAHHKFHFTDGSKVVVGVFCANTWEGEPVESEEMKPQWFPYTEIPYKNMWQPDATWLPRVLAGEQLEGVVQFASDGRTVQSEAYTPLSTTQW